MFQIQRTKNNGPGDPKARADGRAVIAERKSGTALGARRPSAFDEFASAVDKALAWFAIGAGRLDSYEVAVGRSRYDDALALIELADNAFAIRASRAYSVDFATRALRGHIVDCGIQ